MSNDFSAAATAPLSSIATAMIFGTITFATAALATRTWLTADNRAILVAMNPKSQPLDIQSFISIYSLLHHFTVFGLILFFAYICEYHPPFPHAEKTYDRDEFFFLTALVITVSLYTVHKNDSSNHGQNNNTATNNVPVIQNNGGGGGGTSAASLENKLQTISERSISSSASKSSNQHNNHNNNNTNNIMDEYYHNDEIESQQHQNNTDDSTYKSYYTTGTMSTFLTKGTLQTNTYIHPNPTKSCDDLLNRDQTEEWKGWMQFIFLLYHYYHAEEIYNSIRVMITCYVWMTGFGNFSFFYLKGDYSLVRVLQMLWRLNFLVIFLCLSQGTTYILYYICPLHTYFFLMVYTTMSVGKHLNYSKYGLRLKLFILALIIYILWDVDSGFFRMVHFPFFGTKPMLGATNGALWEWYFRTALDHWSTFLGMIFAANFPITSLFFRKLEALPPLQCWLGKGIIALGLVSLTLLWVLGPFSQDKFTYNATNSYFGFIPLITYIYLRNITPTMRKYSLRLLHEIGKTTLETYLMQHHIWLTSNAKSLLTLIPGLPKVNMLLVTLIYFYTSRRLYKMTLYLRGMLLPDNKKKCITSLSVMGCTIAAFYLLAFLLDSFGMTSLITVAIVSIVFGILLYQTIMDNTWESYHQSSKEYKDDSSFALSSVFSQGELGSDSSVAKLSPPIIGTMIILIVGISWQGMAIAGAGKITPLHAGCDTLANKGRWIPVDGCNEYALGDARRKFQISNFATCNPAGGGYTWGWEIAPSSTHCQFVQRNKKLLLKSLRDQRIGFVGDSMTRNLYHSFCRQLGIDDAGQFDATGPKHQDIARTIQKTGVEFKWAPLASEQVMAVKTINDSMRRHDVSKFDLVVVGGGAWDRLHLYATDEDKVSLRQTLELLKNEIVTLQGLGSPVVWLTPTTINTPALNTPEKRDHMTEEDMADMRRVYEESGIPSKSAFVIDGPGFTKDRVNECYDGVHYPNDVYDAGAQILANALDWLLPQKKSTEPFTPLEPGKMANPYLGLMMLCLSFIGLLFFDAFFGFSYLAGIFVKGILPCDLYAEAFVTLHEKMKLPPISTDVSSSASVATLNTWFTTGSDKTKNTSYTKQSTEAGGVRRRSPGSGKKPTSDQSVDDEIAALLGDENMKEYNRR